MGQQTRTSGKKSGILLKRLGVQRCSSGWMVLQAYLLLALQAIPGNYNRWICPKMYWTMAQVMPKVMWPLRIFVSAKMGRGHKHMLMRIVAVQIILIMVIHRIIYALLNCLYSINCNVSPVPTCSFDTKCSLKTGANSPAHEHFCQTRDIWLRGDRPGLHQFIRCVLG